MPNQLPRYTGVIQSDSANTASALVERDASGDVYANVFRGAAGVRTSGHLFVKVVSKTANYTAAATETVILVDATSGAITITLPAVAGVDGQVYVVKKIDSSGNAVTVDASSSELIDGAANVSLATQWAKTMIVSNGSAWYTV
jgi:hypothetical protein